MASAPVIDISNLFFSYEEAPILENVSLTVQGGEFIGIIGPNGGGKTTLLKVIMGFLRPQKGKVEIFGSTPKEAHKHLAYVPQALRFDKQFPISVLELVLGGRLAHIPWYGKFRQSDKEAALAAIEQVGLLDYKHQTFGMLSGGQAQRALIARALASEPDLLLLDEPTASVDSQAEADIYQLLKDLSGKMTILMVTHDLRTIIHQVQRVLCVQRQVLSLLPEQVCEHFALGLYHTPLINLRS